MTCYECNAPNMYRLKKKLLKLQETKLNANLWDVIRMHQIRYSDKAKVSNTKWMEIKSDLLDKKIREALSKFKINESEREEYRKLQMEELEKR